MLALTEQLGLADDRMSVVGSMGSSWLYRTRNTGQGACLGCSTLGLLVTMCGHAADTNGMRPCVSGNTPELSGMPSRAFIWPVYKGTRDERGQDRGRAAQRWGSAPH